MKVCLTSPMSKLRGAASTNAVLTCLSLHGIPHAEERENDTAEPTHRAHLIECCGNQRCLLAAVKPAVDDTQATKTFVIRVPRALRPFPEGRRFLFLNKQRLAPTPTPRGGVNAATPPVVRPNVGQAGGGQFFVVVSAFILAVDGYLWKIRTRRNGGFRDVLPSADNHASELECAFPSALLS